MEKIFENAYFGKAYKTRDGRKAVYWRKFDFGHRLIDEKLHCSLFAHDDGRVQAGVDNNADIVSEWQEEISEEELDKLAKEYSDRELKEFENDSYWGTCADKVVCSAREEGTYIAFKAGYRKAMEE